MTSQPLQKRSWHPRLLWPRESGLVIWLAENLDQLAACLGVGYLECVGREMVIGELCQRDAQQHGRRHSFTEMRVDLAAEDEHGRLVIVEAQFGPPDHEHIGKLMTYAQIVRPHLAVWLVADLGPTFDVGHLNTLAEQDAVFAGRRRYAVVAVTVDSDPRPGPLADDEPVQPRLHHVPLHEPEFQNTPDVP